MTTTRPVRGAGSGVPLSRSRQTPGTGSAKRFQERVQPVEGLRHVGAAEAEADVAWLVVDRAREQQDLCFGGRAAAELVDVAEAVDPRKADRAAHGPHPRERAGVPLEERVEQQQVALDDGA